MNFKWVLLVALVNLGLTVLTTTGHGGFGNLVPLLPVAAITGHSGLLTAGLTGAALLKLKAAGALIAFLSARKKKYHSHDHGWKKPSHGWKSHDHEHETEVHIHSWKEEEVGWHRRRRAVEAIDAGTGAVLNTDLSEFDPSLDDVLQYDQLGCGMRLVCELSAAPSEALFDDEKLILDLFGRGEKTPNPAKASRGKLSYSYAALLGENAKDFNVCSNVYGRCPYSAHQVMQSLREANV